eukprot:3325998-Rhodomonas_salina.1
MQAVDPSKRPHRRRCTACQWQKQFCSGSTLANSFLGTRWSVAPFRSDQVLSSHHDGLRPVCRRTRDYAQAPSHHDRAPKLLRVTRASSILLLARSDRDRVLDPSAWDPQHLRQF